MKFKAIILFTLICGLSAQLYAGDYGYGPEDYGNEQNESPEGMDQDQLKIFNNTSPPPEHPEQSGRGLFLLWEGDQVRHSPVTTERLEVGQSDTKDSTYIGNGNNARLFNVTVYIWNTHGDKVRVGKFPFIITNGPRTDPRAGHGPGQKVRCDITNEFSLGQIDFFHSPDNGDSGVRSYFGSIRLEDW